MPEIEIACEKGGREELFAEFCQFWWIEEDGCAKGRQEQDGEEGRKNATHPAFIKRKNRKPPGLQILDQQRRDEITGYDVKDVDPDQAVSKGSETQVIEEHRQNGDGTKAINVRAIFVGTSGDRLKRDSGPRPWRSRPLLDGCLCHGMP